MIPAMAPPEICLRLGCAFESPDPEPQLSDWALSTSEVTVRRSIVYEYISMMLRTVSQKSHEETVASLSISSSDNALRG